MSGFLQCYNNFLHNIELSIEGWGTTSSGGSTSAVLKETTVKIVAQNDASCTPVRDCIKMNVCQFHEDRMLTNYVRQN